MKIHKVESTAVEKIGYDRKKSKLLVKFKSGHSYMYKKVGKNQFTQLRKAESVGKFLHDKILGRYESHQIFYV